MTKGDFGVCAFGITIVTGVFTNNRGTFKKGLQGFPKVVLALEPLSVLSHICRSHLQAKELGLGPNRTTGLQNIFRRRGPILRQSITRL